MSLMSPRLIAPLIVLSLAASMIVSCAQQNSPTAPSSVASTALQSVVTEYVDTLVDETPAPAPAEPVVSGPSDDPPPPPPSGSAPEPWPPGPPPNAAPGVPVPTPPSTHFRLSIKIDPEPVPYSGKPVGIFGCRDRKHTWYYDQHLHAETGIKVKLTERENFFDGRFVSKISETIQLDGNGSAVLHTRWCSGYSKPHYTQTRFKGADENGEPITISGPWVRLLSQ